MTNEAAIDLIAHYDERVNATHTQIFRPNRRGYDARANDLNLTIPWIVFWRAGYATVDSVEDVYRATTFSGSS